MFIVMPVLAIYALEYNGANEMLVGLTFGAYSFAQMLFVVPFGKLSDIIGRKKTIIIGLVIFAIGSIICIYAKDIYTLMLGRLLQGSGAISAVTSALISDLVKEEQRTNHPGSQRKKPYLQRR
jgi:MFS family permease